MDVHFFLDGTEELLARRLKWHTIAVTVLFPLFFIRSDACVFSSPLYLLLLHHQVAQLTHILDERLKEFAKNVEREKALKDVAAAMAKKKDKATEAAEKKAQSAKKARVVVEKKLAETESKLGGMELNLAEVESINLAQADEIANLKVALDAFEEKGYNEGFVDAENSVEPIVHQAQYHRFGEGWLAALQAMGVAKDSPLRNPEQIPYLAPPPPI